MMEARLIEKTLGALATAYIITPPRTPSARIMEEFSRAYSNTLRAAMGIPSNPPAHGRPPMTIAGARQHLYDTNRQ